VLLLTLLPLLSVALGNPEFVREVDLAQAAREEKLTAYRVTETYTLRNTRFSELAVMVVHVSYQKGHGKSYQVVSRVGPSFLHTAVLDRVLKEEGEMSRGEIRENALVTSVNYTMKLLGQQILEGRTCEVLELTPRKKSPHLLQGKAWVDAKTHNLIRVEGKPTASISFWAGAPLVIRDYIEIGGFAFARRSRATSHNFLLGHSELIVEYSEYHIDQLEASPPPAGKTIQ
jgi:hypothetical protein